MNRDELIGFEQMHELVQEVVRILLDKMKQTVDILMI